MYQDVAKTMVYWTYNATNPLPNCIRKCSFSFIFSLFYWLPLNNIFFQNPHICTFSQKYEYAMFGDMRFLSITSIIQADNALKVFA